MWFGEFDIRVEHYRPSRIQAERACIRNLSTASLEMFAVRPVPLRLVPGLGRRCSRQSSTLPPPPEVKAWNDELTSRPPRWAKDLVDAQRTSHLQKTLPTRVGPTPLGLPSAGPGDSLPKGHHLVLFQPQTRLDALGPDGSSTVRPRPPRSADSAGVQPPRALPAADVGGRLVPVESRRDPPYRRGSLRVHGGSNSGVQERHDLCVSGEDAVPGWLG